MSEKLTPLEKITILHEESKVVLRVVRDLRAGAKSTKKTRLTKIERHAALLVDLYEDLKSAYAKDGKF